MCPDSLTEPAVSKGSAELCLFIYLVICKLCCETFASLVLYVIPFFITQVQWNVADTFPHFPFYPIPPRLHTSLYPNVPFSPHLSIPVYLSLLIMLPVSLFLLISLSRSTSLSSSCSQSPSFSSSLYPGLPLSPHPALSLS